MAKRSKTSYARAARKGWETKREAAQARSRSARKGWKTRRKKYGPTGRKPKREITPKPKPKPAPEPPLSLWLVTTNNDSAKKSFDYLVSARSAKDAIVFAKAGNPATTKKGWTWSAIPTEGFTAGDEGEVEPR